MDQTAYVIVPESAEHAAAIDLLNENAFGPGRFAKSAYRLREGVPHNPALSFVALGCGALIGSVRLTPIRIGARPAVLLGPLAVKPSWSGRGAGKALVRTALLAAGHEGHGVVMLVGDEPYYGPLGFRRLAPYQVTLPGPADPGRVLFAELVPGALDGLAGQARRVA